MKKRGITDRKISDAMQFLTKLSRHYKTQIPVNRVRDLANIFKLRPSCACECAVSLGYISKQGKMFYVHIEDPQPVHARRLMEGINDYYLKMRALRVENNLSKKVISDRVKRIRMIMDSIRISQVKLADKSGISKARMSRCFIGDTVFTKKDIATISEALGVNHNWLMTGRGEVYDTQGTPQPAPTLPPPPAQSTLFDAVPRPDSGFYKELEQIKEELLELRKLRKPKPSLTAKVKSWRNNKAIQVRTWIDGNMDKINTGVRFAAYIIAAIIFVIAGYLIATFGVL